MHVQLDLICLYNCFIQVTFVTSASTWIGGFKVTQRSPKIKRCASDHLSKKEFSGYVRASDSTGHCEGLSGPWDEDEEKLEPGFVYARLFSKKEGSKPPISMKSQADLYLKFPVVFTTGSSFSLNVTWPKMAWDTIHFSLYKDSNGDKINYLFMSIIDRGKNFELHEPYDTTKREQIFYEENLQGTECKITFVAKGNNSLEILFNDKTMITWKGQSACFDQLGTLKIYYREEVFDDQFQIHEIEYNQGNSYLTNC